MRIGESLTYLFATADEHYGRASGSPLTIT